jgi:hypothetical protein
VSTSALNPQRERRGPSRHPVAGDTTANATRRAVGIAANGTRAPSGDRLSAAAVARWSLIGHALLLTGLRFDGQRRLVRGRNGHPHMARWRVCLLLWPSSCQKCAGGWTPGQIAGNRRRPSQFRSLTTGRIRASLFKFWGGASRFLAAGYLSPVRTARVV